MQSRWCGLLAGTNSFDNIRWFNKELSDDSLNKVILLLALAGKTADFANIQKLNKLLTAAKTKAAYKCELMLKEFKPKEVLKKAVKKATEKTVTSKSTSKTTAKSTKKPASSKTSAKSSAKPATKKPAKTPAKKTAKKSSK